VEVAPSPKFHRYVVGLFWLVFVKLTVCPLAVFVNWATGSGLTVTVTAFDDGELHPAKVVVAVYVPALVTVSVEPVNPPGFHVVPEDALEESSTLPPAQKVVGPDALMTGAEGTGFTVTTTGLDAKEVHPFAVAVTVNVPLDVTLMVGVVELFDQAFPEAALELRVTDPPAQKLVGPLGVIMGVAGVAFTVTVTGAEAREVQPPDVWVTV
jgi:hypothetical protein